MSFFVESFEQCAKGIRTNLIPGLNKGRDGWDIQCISEQAEELVLQGTGLEQQDIHHRVSEKMFSSSGKISFRIDNKQRGRSFHGLNAEF